MTGFPLQINKRGVCQAVFQQADSLAGTSTSFNLGSQGIGAISFDRSIVVQIAMTETTTGRTPSSVTLGGIGMSLVNGAGSGHTATSLWFMPEADAITLSTTAALIINYSVSVVATNISAVWACYGLEPTSWYLDNTTANLNGSGSGPNVPIGTMLRGTNTLVFGAAVIGGSGSGTWTGLTMLAQNAVSATFSYAFGYSRNGVATSSAGVSENCAWTVSAAHRNGYTVCLR